MKKDSNEIFKIFIKSITSDKNDYIHIYANNKKWSVKYCDEYGNTVIVDDYNNDTTYNNYKIAYEKMISIYNDAILVKTIKNVT